MTEWRLKNERLTTNKPVDEMSMLELVYNSCYIKDGNAVYRDYETERDSRDFVRNLYKAHLNEEMPTDDDVFDESMIDELQYEPEEHLYGLIALFYRNLWAMADMHERLKAYEDKQEQGLLRMNAKELEKMDAQEALRIIVEDGIELGAGDFVEVEALKIAADALKKQIPKRPSYSGDGYADGYLVYDTYECPNCGKQYEVDYDDYDYCPNCGQKLDMTMEGEDGREESM